MGKTYGENVWGKRMGNERIGNERMRDGSDANTLRTESSRNVRKAVAPGQRAYVSQNRLPVDVLPVHTSGKSCFDGLYNLRSHAFGGMEVAFISPESGADGPVDLMLRADMW
jgi:hypothetical protein